MPWPCANCGASTNRSQSTYDKDGDFVKEVCPNCKQEEFEGALISPSDQKVYPGPAAMPNLYTRDAEGTYHAKDELIADTVALWDKGPTEKLRDQKRATRRMEPLTQKEIDAAVRWGNECLAPLLQQNPRSTN